MKNSPLPLRRFHRVVSIIMLLTVTGCASGLMSLPQKGLFSGFPDLKKKDLPDDDPVRPETDNDFINRVETSLLSEYISVQGNHLVVLRGVGLVTGLNGTGDDPAPSALRTMLQAEMTRRGVRNPSRVLASKDTALVVVTAYLPAMVRDGQRFDVRVAVPPSSNASSLQGGWLLETPLYEEQELNGQTVKGHNYGVAGGAILTELGVRKSRGEVSAELRRGTIPGGAISKTDRNLSIVLRTDKRGYRNSKRIASAVSERFHDYNRYGQRVSLAEAKTDTLIDLTMHRTYRNNFPRYQQVIRNIAFNETDVARRMRMEFLEEQILDPATCLQASLQYEAIGEGTIPFLKRALSSDNVEVRFHASQALAYLGDPSGVEDLRHAVENEPALRVYALAALSVIDEGESVMALRDLMSADSLETRYGAFKALQELNPADPALIRKTFENMFTLYMIDSEGEPMSHVTRRRAPEVILFGANQPLRMPVVLNAGRNIRVAADGSSHSIEITKYSLEHEEPQRQKVPNRLRDIIIACGEFGATYPDIVQLMIEADQQQNLVGEFDIDRMPQAGRMYFQADESEGSGKARRIGTASMIPNLFDKLDEDEIREFESDEHLESLKFDTADEGEPATTNGKSGNMKPDAADEDSNFVSSDTDSGNSDTTNSSDMLVPEKTSSATSERTSQTHSGETDFSDEEFDAPELEEVDLDQLDSGFGSGLKKFFTKTFSG
ncbi:MAG: flagellar basal body P-ring protein FlgI [Planctomycetaceae bacterium]